MARKSIRRVYVLPETIKRLCEVTRLSHNDLSRSIGHTSSFFYHLMKQNEAFSGITQTDVIAIKAIHGIDIEKIDLNVRAELESRKECLPETKPESKPEPEPEPEPEKTQIDTDKLYKLIYSAVFNAVKAAWEDAPTLEEDG